MPPKFAGCWWPRRDRIAIRVRPGRLSSSSTTPGWTRAVALGIDLDDAIQVLLKSITKPAPIDCPERLVPPPRGTMAQPGRGAQASVHHVVDHVAAATTAQRLNLVDAGVGAVQAR